MAISATKSSSNSCASSDHSSVHHHNNPIPPSIGPYNMLSKEEKLRYGEILRQQMKEKEDRKRQQDMMKRGPPLVPPQRVQSDRLLLADPQPYPPHDPKQILQKKLETQDYNPFGRAGGGAPNPKQEQSVTVNEGNHSALLYPHHPPQHQEEMYPQRPPPAYKQEQQPVYSNGRLPPGSMGSYQLPNTAQYRPQEGYQQSINEYPPRQYHPTHPEPPQIPTHQQYPPEPRGNPYMEAPPLSLSHPPPPLPEQRVRTLQNEQMQEMYRRGGRNLLKLQNQTANEHLVKQKQKLEMQAFLKQQMEEAEMRKQLEKQKLKREEMEEERRNKEYIQLQNQKLRDEERKKNEEKQKIADENMRNLARRKELEQQAKDKLERERLAQIDSQNRQAQQERERDRERQDRERDRNAGVGVGQVRERREPRQPSRGESDSLESTSSNQTTSVRGFNTDISRQFFRKEREKQPQKFRNDKKLQMFTNQIQKMRDEISNQGEMFQKEIQRIKREAENAQVEKRKAEFQIEKLKLELERKNRQAQLKLLEALKRNDPYPPYQPPPNQYNRTPPNQQDYYRPSPQQDPYRPSPQQPYDSLSEFQQPKKILPPTPPKMHKTNKVHQEYDSPSFIDQQAYKLPAKQSRKGLAQQYEPRRLDQSEVMTLQADSKKIPIGLQANTKLTMSKIENYGKDSAFYAPQPKQQPKRPQHPVIHEQEEEPRGKSRQPADELDRLMGSRESKRWGMSNVGDDITNQIQQLLKKKEREGSRMGEAGRQVLSRGGLPYEGNLNTMSSNRISAVSNGTLDIDKVHDRNEARLRELKALGVETINTNNDDELNRLNELLKHYQ